MPQYGWTNAQTGAPTGWNDPDAVTQAGNWVHYSGANPNAWWGNDNSWHTGDAQAGITELHDSMDNPIGRAKILGAAQAAANAANGKYSAGRFDRGTGTWSVYNPTSKAWETGKSWDDFSNLYNTSPSLQQQGPLWQYQQDAQDQQAAQEYKQRRDLDQRVFDAQKFGTMGTTTWRFPTQGID